MNYSVTQTDMANPDTQYCDSTHLSSFADLHFTISKPRPNLAKPRKILSYVTFDPLEIRIKFSFQLANFNYFAKPSPAKLSSFWVWLSLAQLVLFFDSDV